MLLTVPIPVADELNGVELQASLDAALAAVDRVAIIHDCDPGHDDAFAIMLAAAHPRLMNVDVARSVDVDRFWRLMLDSVATLGR